MKKLTELETFVHPESRLQEQDLVSSKPGRTNDRNSSNRHNMEPHHTQKDEEMIQFAKQISHYLKKEHEKASFAELYLIASPNILGHLRNELTPTTLGTVTKEINKDIVRASPAEILAQIFS
jgi:protein required for attachment to host cells